MNFELKHAIKGDLVALAKAHDAALSKAVTQIVRNKTRSIHRAMTRRITRAKFRAGGGRRVARDLGQEVYPRAGTFSTGAVGRIYSKAGRARARGRSNGRHAPLIDIFQATTFVRPRRSKWLAIPTEAGRRLAGGARNRPREITPRTFQGGGARRFKQLQFIRAKRGGNARLVLKARPDVTVFILIRMATIRRRFNLLPIFNRSVVTIPDAIARRFDRVFPAELRRAKR